MTVNETDKPFESNYTVDMLGTKNIVNVQLYLGFRRTQSVSVYLRQVVNNLINQGILPPQTPKYSTMKDRKVGGFRFVIVNEEPADLTTSDIKPADRRLIAARIFLQNITASPVAWYGLEFSNVVEESTPLFINKNHHEYMVQRKIYNAKTKRRPVPKPDLFRHNNKKK